MLPPLDEVPVHVHPFAARAPCDSQGSECQCGIHTAEATSALRSRKTERAAKEKADANLTHFFLAPAAPGTPTRRHALGRLPTPPPLPENLLLGLHRKLPSAPPARAPRRFGIRKSASHSGHSPLRGLGGGLGNTSPARRSSPSPSAAPPSPIENRNVPCVRRRKSLSFFFNDSAATQLLPPPPHHAPLLSPPPPPLRQKICYSDSKKNRPLRPCEHPGGSESENRPATRGTAHSEVQGDARCTTRCNVRPIAALHFLLPTGDSR